MAITDDQVLDVISEEVPIDRSELKLDATLESLNIASLDMISVTFALEDKCGIVIQPEDVSEAKTLADFIAIVKSKETNTPENS